ncbi:MAG: hypothetical protein PHH48_01555 [Eubacteriales bacterium]|nr:hypothetical protein [Eubacteriales bacterium]
MRLVEQEEIYYKEKVSNHLKKVIESNAQREILPLEQLEKWVVTDKFKKKKKRKQLIIVSLSLLTLCVGVCCFEYVYGFQENYAMADKKSANITEKDSDVVIKGNGQGCQPGTEEVIKGETKWESVLELKKKYPDLLVPYYIPEGYKFKELTIKSAENVDKVEYIFSDGKDIMYLFQSYGQGLLVVKDYEKKYRTRQGRIVYFKGIGRQRKCYTFITSTSKVTIKTTLDYNSICSTIDKIK